MVADCRLVSHGCCSYKRQVSRNGHATALVGRPSRRLLCKWAGTGDLCSLHGLLARHRRIVRACHTELLVYIRWHLRYGTTASNTKESSKRVLEVWTPLEMRMAMQGVPKPCRALDWIYISCMRGRGCALDWPADVATGRTFNIHVDYGLWMLVSGAICTVRIAYYRP